jgi:hypothetical protein
MELIWTGFGGVVLKQRHKSQHCPANLWFDGWILSNLDSSAFEEGRCALLNKCNATLDRAQWGGQTIVKTVL